MRGILENWWREEGLFYKLVYGLLTLVLGVELFVARTTNGAGNLKIRSS